MNTNHFASILTAAGWPSKDPNDPIQMVGFTSCTSGQGVTTVATQVAIATATIFEKQTLLVDCNFRTPKLHKAFSVPKSPGLVEITKDTEDPIDVIHETNLANLKILTVGSTGKLKRNDEDQLESALQSLVVDFDLLIFDVPTMESNRRSEIFLEMMDRVLIVVDAEKTSHAKLENHRNLLMRHGISLSGVVMNRHRMVMPKTYGAMVN